MNLTVWYGIAFSVAKTKSVTMKGKELFRSEIMIDGQIIGQIQAFIINFLAMPYPASEEWTLVIKLVLTVN
jgi:hypothetical protein